MSSEAIQRLVCLWLWANGAYKFSVCGVKFYRRKSTEYVLRCNKSNNQVSGSPHECNTAKYPSFSVRIKTEIYQKLCIVSVLYLLCQEEKAQDFIKGLLWYFRALGLPTKLAPYRSDTVYPAMIATTLSQYEYVLICDKSNIRVSGSPHL
ncbi:hypothetical protein PHYBLDRAFT_59143 [Phycomyces blakesleeanus NRRL 1555(-)]|uniref:Uncharacterized protein n=1 Tax=Phycomyces blakesleeanus (strain ATCC 8743b / DSM 1359 / FGSC 10004 / NBRC 33097 / NRRL 1555) TaxID=763407 RepID=A0A167QQV4_PHYB8|nr:hypothetical protein PHYBLDRAFT_59143 [Phycomyces blakesleeanus NRRL 1555(-)]OAD80097.1 hypothetical protein PHYBLDRAFT_59143 [Phycomyces blakesleeanus NRRL 1555(-)]|eukprot:XP_018298137.1 hypothetical protein PHYBLDRAFT_59143 [Phycomyces blakesleeanus NRRL 1555(-)]